MSWLPLALLHALSYGFSTLEVGEQRVDVHLRLQILSLVEIFPDLDPDLDGEVNPARLDLRRDDIASYVRSHWRLDVNGAEATTFELRHLGLGEREDHFVLGNMGWIELEFVLGTEDRIDELALEVDLFESTSPGHSEIVRIQRIGQADPDLQAVASVQDEALTWSRPAGPRERWMRGVARGALSWELAFLGPALLFLLLRGATRRSEVVAVTSTCIGLGVASLALAPTSILGLPIHPADLRLLTPLAVAYLASTTLLLGPATTGLVPRALCLGWLPGVAALDPGGQAGPLGLDPLPSATALVLVGALLQIGIAALSCRALDAGGSGAPDPGRPRRGERTPEGLLCWAVGVGALALFVQRLVSST